MAEARRFPGESAAYRAARNQLLAEEAALRRQVEAVAAARRRLPLGGPLAMDYVFTGPDGPRRLIVLPRTEPDADAPYGVTTYLRPPEPAG